MGGGGRERPKMSELKTCKQIAEEHVRLCREALRGWKDIVPMFFVYPAGMEAQLLPVPAEVLERFDEPKVRYRIYDGVRKVVRDSPVPIEYVAYISDTWVCKLNEEGEKHQAEIGERDTTWIVEHGYGERWEALQIRVDCEVGGYMMAQKYKRKTGRLYPEGEPTGREFLLGEDYGPATSFFAVPRDFSEARWKERRPS
jgi:hypothetical protein